MVISDFDVKGIAIDKPEADAPLVVDRDGVLSFPVTAKGVETIPWRGLQIVEASCQIHVLELPNGSPDNLRRKPSALAVRVQHLRLPVGEGSDHKWECKLSRYACQCETYRGSGLGTVRGGGR